MPQKCGSACMGHPRGAAAATTFLSELLTLRQGIPNLDNLDICTDE